MSPAVTAAPTATVAAIAPVISARGLQLAFPGGRTVIDGIDLDVVAGEFVLITGRSGSGKSTLLSACCGLMPHSTGGSLGGELRVGEHDLREAGPSELGQVCGWVGQDPEAQLLLGSPRGEIALGPQLRGEPAGEVARAVEEAAQALGVHALLDRDVRTLSGGEQQRVAVAAAIAQRPQVLLLDEPTSQLDPVAADELIGLLRRFHDQWGLTILLAEHRVDRCLAAATRVISLDGGQIRFDGPTGAYADWSVREATDLSTAAARLLDPFGHAAAAATPAGARCALAELGVDVNPAPRTALTTPKKRARKQRGSAGEPAVDARGVWRELKGGKTLLRAVDLEVAPGEAIAVMGANGAGKSTLLRLLAGLDKPDRGKVKASGRVALLMQRAGDHLLHDRVGDELWEGADLDQSGLASVPGLLDRHPTELSGGERQRLAALVVTGQQRPAALCLDEPTRGLDAGAKHRLAEFLAALRTEGTATIVATHDPDFAASVADRIVLIAAGRVIADAPAQQLLAAGWSLATEVARLLGGHAVTETDGAAWLREQAGERR